MGEQVKPGVVRFGKHLKIEQAMNRPGKAEKPKALDAAYFDGEQIMASDGRVLVSFAATGTGKGWLTPEALTAGRATVRGRRDEAEYVLSAEPPGGPTPAAAMFTHKQWEAVVPKHDPKDPSTVRVGLNVHLLQRIVAALGGDGRVWLTFKVDSDGDAMAAPMQVQAFGETDVEAGDGKCGESPIPKGALALIMGLCMTTGGEKVGR